MADSEKKLGNVTWTPAFQEENYDYYANGDEETLTYESIYDYLQALAVDGVIDPAELLEEDESVPVYAYARMKCDHPCWFLDDLLYSIAEDDGMADPEGGRWTGQLSVSAMDELRSLEKYMGERIRALYRPWGCVPVLKVIVPFKAFFADLNNAEKKPFLESTGIVCL